IPISLHLATLIVEDENGRRTYEDIYYIQGGWKDERCIAWKVYEYVDVGADSDLKIADEFIKVIMSKYEPKKGNVPKIPVKIEIEEIDFNWEILKNSVELLRFEVIVNIHYHWENGTKSLRVPIKFPSGEIDVHPLARIYWDGWIVNSVAKFIQEKDLFDPQTWVLDKRGYLTNDPF
ncbi:MAG: hypothetical protein QXX84_07025, partial [Sulfolobales archaeon]